MESWKNQPTWRVLPCAQKKVAGGQRRGASRRSRNERALLVWENQRESR